MTEQELRAAAIQESLQLSKQDAMRVLVFIAGLQAGKELMDADGTDHQQTVPARRTYPRPRDSRDTPRIKKKNGN